MRKILNNVASLVLHLGLVAALSIFAFYSAKHQGAEPDVSRIRSPENVTSDSPLLDGAMASRRSAIKVLSLATDKDELLASSGTYVTLDSRYFILTTAHGINRDCDLIKFLSPTGNGEYIDCQKIIVINAYIDYAIIEVEEIPAATPVNIATHVPNNREWEESFAVLNSLVYTGYPNNLGVVTIEGVVMGYFQDARDVVFLHSYGWSGASGSGVFDKNGHLVGFVVAILIGESPYGVDVLEDVVIVVPLFNINWSIIYHR